MVEEFETLQSIGTHVPYVFILVAVLIGLVFEYGIFALLRRWSEKKAWTFASIVLNALRGQVLYWMSLVGAGVSLSIWTLGTDYQAFLPRVVSTLMIISLTIMVIRLLNGIVNQYANMVASLSLLNNIITVVGVLLGLTLWVYAMGLSMAPLLTLLAGSGIGLAVVLQGPLSNLFAGVLLVATNRIQPGNYVRLSSGEEGYVTDIKWHTTTIRQLMNNMIVVPNSVMVSAIVVNFDLPEKEMSILIDVGVSYESNLKHVEEVTIDVATEVMQEITGGVPTASPFIRYNAFADFSVNFTVIMRGKEFVDQYLIKHEFIKRLHERYNQEGIVIPFPIRTLQTNEHHPLGISHFSSSNGQHERSERLEQKERQPL